MGLLCTVSGSTNSVLLRLLLRSQRRVMKAAAHPLSDLFSFQVGEWISLGRKNIVVGNSITHKSSAVCFYVKTWEAVCVLFRMSVREHRAEDY